jgi:acyl-coenzyme A synthetase/AMP-(fatty) acid ligase
MLKAGMSFDGSSAHKALRYITVSGGDMPLRQLERLPEMTGGAGIFKTYGQTEAFRATALRPHEFLSKQASVGRPFGGARIYVVREDGSRCGPGEEGEIVHAGLGSMIGYLDGHDPQRKARANPFLERAGDPPTAIFTGDLGCLDEDGYLYVHGRRDEMLKVAGNRVYPAEIAGQLLEIAGTAAAEIVGVKDREGRTCLFAFVVLAAGATLAPVEIRRRMSGRVPPYMLPAEVVILPVMPRTASGKPDRPALTEKAGKLLEGGVGC